MKRFLIVLILSLVALPVHSGERDLFIGIKETASNKDKKTVLDMLRKYIDPRVTKSNVTKFREVANTNVVYLCASYDVEGRKFNFSKQKALHKLAGKLDDPSVVILYVGKGSSTWRSKGLKPISVEGP